MIRSSLLLSNVAVLAVILTFVLHNPSTDGLSAPAILSNAQQSAASNPLDEVSSADIALTVARMNNLPESTAINSQAQSQAAELASVPSNNNVISKPQVVATALKSRADIKSYAVVACEVIGPSYAV